MATTWPGLSWADRRMIRSRSRYRYRAPPAEYGEALFVNPYGLGISPAASCTA
jgi:hypothetical protein